MSTSPDAVIIIGGGPAGASAACRLAHAGFRVVLIEREAGPARRVCGEFLSRAASAELGDLGIEPDALGAAAIHRIRIVSQGEQAEAASPFIAWGLSREILDEQILARARQAGADVRRGIAVRRLRRIQNRWRARLADGSAVEASTVLLATGKHDLRDHRRPADGAHSTIGLKMHWQLAPSPAAAIAEHIELVWFDGGYAGLQPIEGGHANLCLVLRAETYRGLGKGWGALLARLQYLAPHLRARLEGALPAAPMPAAVAGMPYGYVHAAGQDLPGLYRLGDQFVVIPSFTGEGMALALRTGRLAATALTAGATARAYHAAARAEIQPVVGRARRLAWLAQHPLAQTMLVQSCHVLPRLLTGLARRTRVSARS